MIYTNWTKGKGSSHEQLPEELEYMGHKAFVHMYCNAPTNLLQSS